MFLHTILGKISIPIHNRLFEIEEFVCFPSSQYTFILREVYLGRRRLPSLDRETVLEDLPEKLLDDNHYHRTVATVQLIELCSLKVIFSQGIPSRQVPISHTSANMVNLIDLLHQKLELFRLEQRYTRRRNRRSTFVSEAQYVDGEYIYSPTSTYSAKCSAGSDSEAEGNASDRASGSMSKASKRLSRMGLDKMDWRKGGPDKRQRTVSVREVKWDGRA